VGTWWIERVNWLGTAKSAGKFVGCGLAPESWHQPELSIANQG
jgi:hypothetical protein